MAGLSQCQVEMFVVSPTILPLIIEPKHALAGWLLSDVSDMGSATQVLEEVSKEVRPNDHCCFTLALLE